MSYTTKAFEDLDLIDDFLMNATAGDEEVGEVFSRTLLEGLLQRELGNIQISIQKVILPDSSNHRGIRLDVEINEYEEKAGKLVLKNIYDIEPNKRKSVDLPKHNRFYQAKIDSRNMKRMEYMKWDALMYYERMDGKVEALFECLEELGDIPEEIREKIQGETDLELLTKWLKLVVRAESMEDFIEKM